MEYVTISGVEYSTIYAPMWYHLKGLTQTATGYGKKLNTSYKVLYAGRERRIYCCCFSNCGTCYIIANRNKISVS